MATAAPSVDPAVLRSIEDHVRTDAGREKGGVLVGTIDDGVEVDAVIPALEASGPSENIFITHKVWDEVREQVDREHPDKQIVGWYRSNADVGAEVSEYDLFIQQRFFDDPGMVALMIDPETGEASWFAWRGGELEQIPVGDAPAALVEPDVDPEAVAAAAALAALATAAPEVEPHIEPEPEAELDDGGEPGEPAVVAPAGTKDRRGVAIIAALVVAAIVGAGYLLFARDDSKSKPAAVSPATGAPPAGSSESSGAATSAPTASTTASTPATAAASTVPATTPPGTATPSTAPPPTAAAPPPPSTPAPPPANGSGGSTQTYTVQKGDTLWGLAERFYGNGAQYTLILNANPGTTEAIKVGDTLQIPAASTAPRDALPPSE